MAELRTVTVGDRTYKLGRVVKSALLPNFQRYSLFGSNVPSPPASLPLASYLTSELNSMFRNDVLGDCVIADAYHYLGGITAGAGKAFIATNNQVTNDYSNACGYPPDEGCDVQQVLSYYQSTGFADGSKLSGWLAIDPTNPTAVQQAIWLFGGVAFGVGLPDHWLNPMPQSSGFTWDVAGNSDQSNGHCFEGQGYDTQGVQIVTWAMTGTITWAAVAKYASAGQGGELYARVNPGMINPTTGLAPNGLNLNQICTYFNAMGGSVAVPPAPVTPPNPVPNPSPTPGVIVSAPVAWGPYSLTVSGVPVSPVSPGTPPVLPDVTVTWNGQQLTLSAK